MIRMSWARAASVGEALVLGGASVDDTLALWAASLREIKQRIRPLFTQERVATNAGLFLEGLLGDEQRKTGWKDRCAADPNRSGDHPLARPTGVLQAQNFSNLPHRQSLGGHQTSPCESQRRT